MASVVLGHIGASLQKDGLERAFMAYVLDLAKVDARFAEVWEAVKAEEIEE